MCVYQGSADIVTKPEAIYMSEKSPYRTSAMAASPQLGANHAPLGESSAVVFMQKPRLDD
ncbi:MAG TPA: hypothetical protein VKE70_36115 [Candidatus Solibacter sp.]|nr:hypothetical protein [Candidatus Solibacter sp.]